MNNPKALQALFSLKWNPFSPDVPIEALCVPPKIAFFCTRVEQQVRDGGFALISGEPGYGKSVALRLLAHHLSKLPDVTTGVILRPQSRLHDFYREMGELFGVNLAPHNRWAGFKTLRERWAAHLEQTLYRPALLIDEAQEMPASVLSELRLLASANFDSRNLLTVVLCGDNRLRTQLQTEELLPVASRMRARLLLETQTPRELLDLLRHALEAAGNPQLLTPGLMNTIADHCAGVPRILMQTADDLLIAGAERKLDRLDEKLYLELFSQARDTRTRRAPAAAARV
jgi:general secretion pathway protein A